MNVDKSLKAIVDRIKDIKPVEPGGLNCIDFTLGDSGYGVRIILTCPDRVEWIMSTSIGTIVPGKYTPMSLDDWTPSLRVSATAAADEVLELFNIDESTKRVTQGQSVVVFRFKEVQ